MRVVLASARRPAPRSTGRSCPGGTPDGRRRRVPPRSTCRAAAPPRRAGRSADGSSRGPTACAGRSRLARTPSMRRPTSSGRRSRTTVSTSGSSGTGHLGSTLFPIFADYTAIRRGAPHRFRLDRPAPPPYVDRAPPDLPSPRIENAMSVPFAAQPDAQGRFGPYGGRYVPETLMDALRQLTEDYEKARTSPEFQRDFDHYLHTYVGRPSLLYFAERLTKEAGGARIYPQARGPEPHRRPQDQQLHRPGAADQAHGQAAHHRRDGGRPARRRHGHGGGPVRPGVPGLHGRGGRAPAEAQRLQDEGAGHRGGQRRAAAAGRCATPSTRPCATGWRRVATHALHHRQRRRAASVPDDGARFPVGHRPRGAGAVPGTDRPAARCGRGLRRRRQQRGRHVLPVPRRRLGASWSASRRAAAGRRTGDHAATLSHGKPGVLHGAFSYVLQDADGQTAAVHSVSAGLDYPGVGPEHSYWKDSGRVRYTSVGDDEALKAFAPLLAAGGHPAGAGNGPCGGRGDARSRRSGRRTTWWWSASPAAATRIASRWPACRAKTSNRFLVPELLLGNACREALLRVPSRNRTRSRASPTRVPKQSLGTRAKDAPPT